MGSFQTKEKSNNPREKDVEALRAKVELQREELKEIMSMRETEGQAYEQEMMVFALKEAEWKKERKMLREEVKKFKNKLELEKREGGRIIIRENEVALVEKSDNEWKMWRNRYLMEYMREERARRDEAVDKWKRLYLAIKAELDHLIKMTHQGERVSLISEEEILKGTELHKELKAKEETIQVLREKLASMEKENSRTEREVDILRQSLKIISHKIKKGKVHNAKSIKKPLVSKQMLQAQHIHRI